MIKFFRKIRQKLLSENKFSKYLIYAVGEIILVVIGILIALQINNVNESRKASISETLTLQKLVQDLKVDSISYARNLNTLKQIRKLHKELYEAGINGNKSLLTENPNYIRRLLFDTYFDDWEDTIDTSKNLVYEDLDYKLESALDKALSSIRNKIECHANVLHFMSLFFEKIGAHSRSDKSETLHSEDVKNLFLASALLRNPLSTSIPSIDELAAMANMGMTKFKTSFKQLFGSPPIQYRNKIRMEYAREEIVAKRKTPTEISYELGYAHPSNFTAAYKKYFGELPSSHV